MSPTERETVAARRLGESLLEFMLAWSGGTAERDARRSMPARTPGVLAPQGSTPSWLPDHRKQDGAARPPALLGVREAAKYLSISQGLLYKLTAPRGPIPMVRLSARVMYSVKDLDAVVERLRTLPPDSSAAD